MTVAVRIEDIIEIQTPALKQPVAVRVAEVQDDVVVVVDGKNKVHVIPRQCIVTNLSSAERKQDASKPE